MVNPVSVNSRGIDAYLLIMSVKRINHTRSYILIPKVINLTSRSGHKDHRHGIHVQYCAVRACFLFVGLQVQNTSKD